MRMQILTRAVRSQTWRAPSGPRSLSWEVDDQKRDEEDEAGANLRMRRGRFVNDKVDMEV